MKYGAESAIDLPAILLRRMRIGFSDYHRNGYAIVRRGLNTTSVENLCGLVRERLAPYQGQIQRGVRGAPLNLHQEAPQDLADVKQALWSVIFSDALYQTLHALDGEDHYTIHQSLVFLSSPRCDLHIDGWGVDTSPRGYAHTVWIPLEDLVPSSGLPCVIPWRLGHVLDDRDLDINPAIADDYLRYHDALIRFVGSRPTVTAPVSVGDVFVWGSLTPHKTLPADGSSRLSLQVLIRPSRYPYGHFRSQPRRRALYDIENINEHFSYYINPPT